ncbi:TPA: Rop family plasmid primer RNA-binding protein [Escherichia coli]|nr:Rop family plasmid primer RNA-binding protein [Escherichia coli]MBL4514436.1 Rop family plasmid primer RNA-binding protein [Klebsiella pneumoniae]HBJ5183907.1 Rop family plasmid primer RNA-binding protein [Acinetobacter baumannii]HBQ5805620.1 Rop family plasmid primer RNA-binding protein [Klebsiella pneumoniae subsp. pneumoniae]EGO3745891.1 Rop family plasmid primer RNA-binding protein [Escherichia coli]
MNKQQKSALNMPKFIRGQPVIPRYYSLFLYFHVITVDF